MSTASSIAQVYTYPARRATLGRTGHLAPAYRVTAHPIGVAAKEDHSAAHFGIGLGVSLALAATAVAAATSTGPKAFFGPPSKASPTATPITKAVRSVLPAGALIAGATHVQSEQSNYDDVTAQLPDGTTYDFTAYRHLAAGELDGSGLAKSMVEGGALWIGSDNPTRRSVYCLNSAGIGVYVANSSAAGHAASMPAVASEAVRFAAALRSTTAVTTDTTADGNAQPGIAQPPRH